MAHVDAAVITPVLGYGFIAPVGTARPANALITSYVPMDDQHFPGYSSLGHMSRDDLPSFGFEGGDTEVQGTWSNTNFREVTTEVRSDYVTFNALQFDEQILGLYYGTTDTPDTDGIFEVDNAPTSAVEYALLLVMVDGPRRVAFHAPRVSLRAEDSMEMEIDSFAAFPLRATFLKLTGQPLFSWFGVSSPTAEES